MNTETKKEQVCYIKKSDGLLDQARRIFGNDLVVGAWFLSWTPEHVKGEAEMFEDRGGAFIDIGGLTVLLEFCNGKRVRIDSSEWGGICHPEARLEEV